jgi:exosortase/archaeosortase family protein
MNIFVKNNFFLLYVLKFVVVFCIIYFGTIAIIGLSVPGNYYSSTVAHYFNYISWLKSSLLHGSKWTLSIFGYNSYVAPDNYSLKMKDGGGVRLSYYCLGYGVMSFWIAFILANKGVWFKKVKWIFCGLLLIWCINVIRISLLLIVTNKHWGMPLGINHHTWFNIVAYTIIFVLIYFFDKSNKIKSSTTTATASLQTKS